VWDQFIPPRLRLSNGEWIWRIMKAERVPKPALLKQLYGEWRKLGYPLPRGFLFPSKSSMKRQIERRIAMANEIQRLPVPDKMPRGEWERAAADIIRAHLAID